MTKILKILSLVLLCGSQALNAQKPKNPKPPKLVVGIVIEGLKPDYLNLFKENFSSGGFKKLMAEGRYYGNAQYDYLYPEKASAFATIATGANPARHGIVGNKWYNRLSHRNIYCVEDNNSVSLVDAVSTQRCSPKNLLGATVGDELRLSNFKQSKVMSISLNDYSAVLLGGHSNSGAFWFDANLGKWTSGSYYFDNLPYWVQRFNERNLPDIYISKTWDTFLSFTKYNGLADDNSYEAGFNGGEHVFPYNLAQLSAENNRYEMLHYTPFGNTLVREFATSALVNGKLGQDKFPDILMIDFSANAGIAKRFGVHSIEIEDAYIRLDYDIAFLIDFIDDYVGLENVLFFVTSDRGDEELASFLNDIKIPTQKFNRFGMKALTNSYLNVVYNQNSLIDRFDKYGIYFDNMKLDKLHISKDEIQNKTADFIMGFSGVSTAYTAARIKMGVASRGKYVLAENQFMAKRSPDVFIDFEVGTIDRDGDFLHSANRKYLNVPLLFFGWNVKQGRALRRISMTDIAPTISYILGISYPNISTGNIIEDLFVE